MAWTTPGTAVAGDVLTAAFWNSNVRDNSTALPRGLVAEDTSTSTQTLVNGTNADITGLTLTTTFQQNRSYRITLQVFRGTQQGTLDLFAIIGATTLDGQISGLPSTFRSEHVFAEWLYKHTTTTASLTVKGNATANGVNVILINAGGFLPHTLRVFDIGETNF
jgi:hypothetical protein